MNLQTLLHVAHEWRARAAKLRETFKGSPEIQGASGAAAALEQCATELERNLRPEDKGPH